MVLTISDIWEEPNKLKASNTPDECALYRLLALKPEGDCEGGLVSGGLNSSP